jgi:hypothetical protein
MELEISNALSLSNLRTELIKLFNEHSIPTVIFSNNKNWKNLVGFLTYYLNGKSIHRLNKKTAEKQRLKDLVEEINNIKTPENFYIKEILIVGDTSPYWCIKLGGGKNVVIAGKLLLEKPSKT